MYDCCILIKRLPSILHINRLQVHLLANGFLFSTFKKITIFLKNVVTFLIFKNKKINYYDSTLRTDLKRQDAKLSDDM